MKLIQIDNLIIIILILIIILVYCKKINLEQFKNYPISPNSYKHNNYTNDIEMDKLEYLKTIIKKVLFEANDENKIYIFNKSNLNLEKITPNLKLINMVTEMILKSINSKLINKQLKLNDIKCIEHIIAGDEQKILFNLNTTYIDNNIDEENIKLFLELIYINKMDSKKIHLNKIDIIDVNNDFLPGYNINDNDNLILSDDKINYILENDDYSNIDYDNNNYNIDSDNNNYNIDSEINTEEAKSFFDL